MAKRPVMFTEWRSLYHTESKMLGYVVFWRVKCGARTVGVDREIWKLVDRIRRIRKRLDIESEVKDESWCRSMWQMIFGKNKP